MSNEKQGEQAEPVLDPLDQVELLLKKGKVEEAIKIIEGREPEEGLEELRCRVVECKCKNFQGEFEQVIEITEKIIKELEELEELVEQRGNQENNRIRIDALNEQVWALHRLGRLEDGLEKVEGGLRLIAELQELEEKEGENEDKDRKARLLNNKGVICMQKGELDEALELCKDCLAIKEEIGEKRGMVGSYNNIGIIYLKKGELGQALGYSEKALVINEQLGNKQQIARSLNNIGIIYLRKGELDRALEYYEKSLAIKEEIGNKTDTASSLNNIGNVYRRKGELDKALENYEKSLVLMEEMGNKLNLSCSLNSIGELYQELGALEMAFNTQKQCLELREEIGNNLEIAYSLYSLIGVTIDLEEFQQARDYLSTLQLINTQEENKRVDLRCRLAEALILKMSKRRKNLAKAEEILEEIVVEEEKEIIEHQLTVEALINLSEILLDELRLTGEEEILDEVDKKVVKLVEIAKEQQSYTLLTESYWLKAQLALVRLDLEGARSLLTQAQVLAEEKGLERLARKISSEHDQLLEQLDQWEELIAKDASIAERVKVANLEELVGWMARKREIIIEEKEDKPVMLMLVAESGLPIYSKQFDPTKELQDMLISGFLSSINTFVQEVFHTPGMIRRIMHDEYTLSFNLIEPILFCYVYEGQSYTAMKKLNKLITEVYESEVWPALEEVGKKGYKLRNGEIAQMEGMMGEIFITN